MPGGAPTKPTRRPWRAKASASASPTAPLPRMLTSNFVAIGRIVETRRRHRCAE